MDDEDIKDVNKAQDQVDNEDLTGCFVFGCFIYVIMFLIMFFCVVFGVYIKIFG